MKSVFNFMLPALLLAIVGLTGCIPESQARTFTENVNFSVITPPLSTQTTEEGEVEVAEIFWYGCPHCYSLESAMEEYVKNKPDNVTFSRVPAMLDAKWSFHGKLYYVGQMLDADGSKNIHTKIFEALHKQRRRIGNDDQLRRFFEGYGFKKDEINNVLKSMELKTKLEYAKEITLKSNLDSVPALIINGKYLTSPSMVKGNDELLEVVNYLTNLASK